MFEIKRHGGHTQYLLNNKLHRTDGPAYIWDDNSSYSCDSGISYWSNCKYHRTDGPTLILGNGNVGYYSNDVEVTTDELNV